MRVASTAVMTGCASFLIFGVGCFFPTAVSVIAMVTNHSHNKAIRWFIDNGTATQAVVIRKFVVGGRSPQWVIEYMIDGREQPTKEGVAPIMYEEIAVGQNVDIWVAGEKSMLVAEEHPVHPIYYLILIIPAICLPVIIWIERRYVLHRRRTQPTRESARP